MYEYLAWDSEFFGWRMGRVDVTQLTVEAAVAAIRQAATEPIDCLYVLVPAHNRRAIQVAEELSARLVDIRVTLAMPLRPLSVAPRDSVRIRASAPSDVAALREIASSSHGDSRFYSDPRFPREQCDELYGRWIEKRCHDDPDAVLVAELSGDPVGYLALRLSEGELGIIDLVAVHRDARGAGIGMQLTAASFRWLTDAGCRAVRVVTQGGNVPALRFYGSVGFAAESVDLWYHYWPDEAQSAPSLTNGR